MYEHVSFCIKRDLFFHFIRIDGDARCVIVPHPRINSPLFVTDQIINIHVSSHRKLVCSMLTFKNMYALNYNLIRSCFSPYIYSTHLAVSH